MTLLIGMAVANLVGGVLCFGVTKLSEICKGANEGLVLWPSFFLLPLMVGLQQRNAALASADTN